MPASHPISLLRGYDLLRNSEMCASLGAYSHEDRIKNGLRGMLPPKTTDMDLNLARIRLQFNLVEKPLDKYIYLMALQVFFFQLCNIRCVGCCASPRFGGW